MRYDADLRTLQGSRKKIIQIIVIRADNIGG